MENTLHVVFEGNHIDRDVFLSEKFIRVLRKFLEEPTVEDDQYLVFVMLAKEIVKNIYDHADGKGEATFIKNSDSLSFEIKDYGTVEYDLVALQGGGSTKHTSYNRGIGLCRMIPDMADVLGINLHTDCTKGFTYTGEWMYKK